MVILITLIILILISLKSYIHGLGAWLFILVTHGIFVYFGGESLTHLPLYAGLVVISILLITGPRMKPPLNAWLLIALFFTVMTASFISNGGGWDSANKLQAYFKPLVVALIVSAIVQRVKAADILVNYFIAAAVLGGLFNIYQQIFGVQLTINEWDESLNRAAGLRGDPNDTAMLLLPAIPLLYYKLINKSKNTIKRLYMISVVIVVAGIVVTGSRAGFAAMLFSGIAIIFHQPKRMKPNIINMPSKKNILMVLIFLLVAVIAAPSYYWDRMKTLTTGEEIGSSNSLYNRLYLLEGGVKVWIENPVLGVGPGNFDKALFGEDIYSDKKAVAHNAFVELLAETGFLGFIFFVSICFFAVHSCLVSDRKFLSGVENRYIGYSWSGAIVLMLMMCMTLSQGYNSVLWFAIGLGFSSKQWRARSTTKNSLEVSK